jgi:hypothetical protein
MRIAPLKTAVVLVATFFAGTASAAVISIVGTRAELSTIQAEFVVFGDTVTRYNTDWNSLTGAQLDAIFASDVVWEGDIFAAIPGAVQTRMVNYVNGNGGLFLTAERPCCDVHNDDIQVVGRALTGDTGLLIGNLGVDIFGHQFSNSPTTILTDPKDIRGQAAQHNGPGRVEPTGGVLSNACFIGSGNPQICTAAAWGPDVLVNSVGRLVIYGDINSQPSLVDNFNGDQFENIRKFLLAGFTGGGSVCDTNPNLPGCTPNGNVPEPASLALLAIGLAGLGVMRRKQRA